MRVKSVSLRSMGLSFLYLVLLGLSMTFLVGCGNSLSTVGIVDSWQDPPEANGSQEQAYVHQNAKGSSAEGIPATAYLSSGVLETAIKANKGWQLLEIREPRELAAGHNQTPDNIPLGDLENNFAKISKDNNIVFIDLNGTRSESAWQTLVKKGYEEDKVKVLVGGMLQWNGIGNAAGSNSSIDNNTNGSGNTAAPMPEVKESIGGC